LKVIVAGSRNISDLSIVELAIDQSGYSILELVSGCALGVDSLGEFWAMERCIPIKRFRANWDLFGNSAGMHRNIEMALYSDALIAVWDGKSRGTSHMIRVAKMQGLQVYVHSL
jgi:hypothetical protein